MIHSLGHKEVSGLHAEQRLQIRSGVEDDLLPGFAFPKGRFRQLLFRDIEAVAGDLHRPVFGIPHQLEFSVCPAILATLGAETQIVAVGTSPELGRDGGKQH